MVAIVTGAGSRGLGVGNGKAAAVLFAREGARVALIDSVLARAEETQTMILAEGGECFAMEANVASGEDCKAIVDATVRRYGRLDILHNNVGIDPGIVSVVDVDEPTWDETMDVNVKSMMLMSKHAIPIMVAGGGGAIVNISSISALRPRGLTPYSVSKGAGYSPHTGDGGRPRPAAGPRQLHRARTRLHADGRGAYDAGTARRASQGSPSRNRGQRLGHRLRSALSRQP